MKVWDFIAIVGFMVLVYFFVDSKLNPEQIVNIDTVYTPGEPVHDTLWQDSIVYIPKWKTSHDTLYIDSSGYHAKADFSFEEDSVKVKGKVYYDEPMFSFSDIMVKYPYKTITITKTDTFKVNTAIIKTPRFSHGIGVGFGYGIINKQLDLYIGYNLQFNF